MRTNKLIIFSLLLPFYVFSQSSCSIFPVHLTCEYLSNPQGLDAVQPRFSWTLEATNETKYAQKQTAYHILVSDSKEDIDNNLGNMWNSGWVKSDNMQLIKYQGLPLLSDKNYYWKIAVKDEKGIESSFSEVAKWSTGLFSPQDWTAKWIGSSQLFDYKKSGGDSKTVTSAIIGNIQLTFENSNGNCNIDDPWLRKVFTLQTKPAKATLFVASVGYNEVYINGKKIGENILAPAVTDNTKRARYIAYDISDELREGKNVIGFWLGASWSIYAPYSTLDKPRTPIVIAQADIYDKMNNKLAHIQTDETWKTHSSSNKLLGTWEMRNYGGEIQDANKEIKDWNSINFNDDDWIHATVYSPSLILSAQQVESNRLFSEINPVDIEDQEDGSFRIDMGVNFTGWTEIHVYGKPGDTIHFFFSERKQEIMTFNIHSAYVVGSNGEGIFRNRFNYSAGRWITIKGQKVKPKLSDIKGWVVRTAFERAAKFECSDSLQNWIYKHVCWTFENLALGGYVVDCPHRERFGYGGDAHATSETGMFNYKLGAFYTKWLQDWRDVQGTETTVGNMNDLTWARKQIGSGRYFGDGVLPHSAPTYYGGGGPAWGGIVVTLPWLLYQHEADTTVLKENFDMIKKWLDFLDAHTVNNILQRYGGEWDFLGDWLWPNATAEGMNNNKPETECFNNCYWIYNLRTAAKIARIIGKTDEANKWEQQAKISSKAIHKKFYNKKDQSYANKSMSNLAAALYGNVMPSHLRKVVMKRLEKEILLNNNGHINVGIIGGAMLFKVLREAGRDDLIYSMTSQTTYPSWGFMRDNGATTIWEMWEKDLPGHSLLHSSFLFPGAWYIDGLGGIRIDSQVPGFKQFIVRIPKLYESKISWAKTDFDSPVGMIKTYWKINNGKISLSITVPPNCEAIVCFPDNKKSIFESSGFSKKIGKENGYIIFKVPSGKYEFSN